MTFNRHLTFLALTDWLDEDLKLNWLSFGLHINSVMKWEIRSKVLFC